VSGTYTYRVTAAATETYFATRTTTTKAHREDTVEAGGFTQTITGGMIHHIHGSLTQTVEPGGSQTVTGGWEHIVTGENHDLYGSWHTEVSAGWEGHFGSAVHLKSDASFKIEAPEAKITASNAKLEVLGLMFDISSNKHELYQYKGASGILKTDHVAISQAFCGLKSDTTLVKLENVPLHKGTHGASIKQLGTYLRQQGTAAIIAGAIAYQSAITKL
jgi:type VI secretion system secreted protein VgrG